MNTLFIICGLSFAGKSTLGSAIAERFGYEQVDVDDMKLRLYGPNIRDDQLTQDDWDKIYTETDSLISTFLQAGKSVIDASRNFKKAERQHIRKRVEGLNANMVTIYVDTPEEVARQRLLENRHSNMRVDYSDAAFDEIVKVMEPPEKDETPLIFRYTDDIKTWITKNTATLVPKL